MAKRNKTKNNYVVLPDTHKGTSNACSRNLHGAIIRHIKDSFGLNDKLEVPCSFGSIDLASKLGELEALEILNTCNDID